jgi:hypothetical protein
VANYKCEDCGRTFTNTQGLAAHRASRHAEALIDAEVLAELRALLAPIEARLGVVEGELAEAQKRVARLTRTRNYLRGSLKRIDPSFKFEPPKANPHSSSRERAVNDPQKLQRVVAVVESGEWPQGFMKRDIYRKLKESGEPIGSDAVAGVIEHLHASGVLRIERTLRGGAALYMLVGSNGA